MLADLVYPLRIIYFFLIDIQSKFVCYLHTFENDKNKKCSLIQLVKLPQSINETRFLLFEFS